MIILKIIGGLGNQMFQTAFAKMLAMELNEDIYLDDSVYNRYKIRKLSIQNLYIYDSLNPIENIELPKATKLYVKLSQKIYHVYQAVRKRLTKNDRIGEEIYTRLVRRGLYYNFDRYFYNILIHTNKTKCVYGYFESEKYFEKHKEYIREQMMVRISPTDREKELLDTIKDCTAVGVSIRIGDDYIGSPGMNVCTKEYFYRGMQHIYDQYKDAVFFIFSDRVDRVKEQFHFDFPVRYIEGFRDYESLRLLYSCKHFVISNSTFSWWGAYLSDNDKKIVAAPSRWRNDSRERPDIYMDTMVLIDPD